MAISRTDVWYTQMNAAFPDVSSSLHVSQSWVWLMSQMLLGQSVGTAGVEGATPSPWTVEHCSDGATVSTSYLWGASFDATKLVRAGAGTAHSWLVLKSPVAMGPLYMLIDFKTSDTTVALTFSLSAFSTGTIQTAPTASNSWTNNYNSSSSNPLDTGGTAAQKLHMAMRGDGCWYMLASKNGTGGFHTLAYCVKYADSHVGDPSPYGTFYNSKGDWSIGAPSTFTVGDYGVYGRDFTNANSVFYESVGHPRGVTFVFGTDANAGSAGIDSALDGVPAYVGMINVPYSGLRGRMPDMFYLAQKITAGALVPVATPHLFVVALSTLLPFSVAPSL